MRPEPTFVHSGSFRRPLLYMAAVAAIVYGQARLRWALLWNRVDATVVDAAVIPWSQYTGGRSALPQRSREEPNYVSVVRFRYVVNGRSYTGDRLREQLQAYARLGQAQSAIAGISPGMQVRAYVDPHDPGNAFLLAQTGAGEHVLVVLCWFLMFLLWISRRERVRRAWLAAGDQTASTSDRASSP